MQRWLQWSGRSPLLKWFNTLMAMKIAGKKYCSFSRKFTSHASETIFQAEDLRSNNWMSNKLKDISNRLQQKKLSRFIDNRAK